MQAEPCTASNSSSSAVVTARPALFCGITLTPGSAACTCIVYDNATTNSGTILASLTGVANGASVPSVLNIPVMCTKGIYVAISGTGASYTAYFSQSN